MLPPKQHEILKSIADVICRHYIGTFYIMDDTACINIKQDNITYYIDIIIDKDIAIIDVHGPKIKIHVSDSEFIPKATALIDKRIRELRKLLIRA